MAYKCLRLENVPPDPISDLVHVMTYAEGGIWKQYKCAFFSKPPS